jgi:hypothetical protein
MKFKWLIQDVGLIQSQINRKFEALDLMNENLDGIGVMANYNYISNLENVLEDDLNTVYIILGGVKVLNLLRKAKSIKDVAEFPTQFQIDNSDIILNALKNGYFYDYEKFDQAYYGNLNLPLLNQNANYIPLADNLNTSFEVDKFIKPTRDLKAFDAGILIAGQTLNDFVLTKKRQRFYLEENIVVSDVKNILDEYRFFVVNNKVITGSAYRRNKKVGEDKYIPNDIQNKAIEYANLYQPSSVFTMDLAKTEDNNITIIEYNCFNCSGVYLCDLIDTFTAIKNLFLNQET